MAPVPVEQLAVVIGPESPFVLLDVAGLDPDTAVARLVDLSEIAVSAALERKPPA